MSPTWYGRTPEQRFWSHVVKTDSCWLWQGYLSDGYGNFRVDNDYQTPAHRYAYELLVGPIPEGLVIDHLCRNRACVNPAHLEPVTLAENILRGEGMGARFARRDHCENGHPFTPENTYVRGGRRRVCRTCKNASARAAYQERRRNGASARDAKRAAA